mgnify:CR=1 FL=1
MQTDLFSNQQELPNGLIYRPDFISREEEQALLRSLEPLPFREAKYKAYRAKRRVVRFCPEGYSPGDDEEGDFPRMPFPSFLSSVRERVCDWLAYQPQKFVHGLITEYRPGTPIGWHRDAPHFELIVGLSMGTSCRMRFRRFNAPPRQMFHLPLAARSIYVMQKDVRWQWQHSIGPVDCLRYSITMRTGAERPQPVRYPPADGGQPAR